MIKAADLLTSAYRGTRPYCWAGADPALLAEKKCGGAEFAALPEGLAPNSDNTVMVQTNNTAHPAVQKFRAIRSVLLMAHLRLFG